MSAAANSSRSTVTSGADTGKGVLFSCSLLATIPESPGMAKTFSPSPFIHIGEDGRVTIIVNKSEMGQGVYTSLPMLVAEELEVDPAGVRVEAAPVDPVYNHTEWGITQATGGSSSVRSSWQQLSLAGARLRMLLIASAAEIWSVDPAALRAHNGFVINDSTGKELSYGTLIEKAARMKLPQDVVLKKQSDFNVIGTSVKRIDTPEKISGHAIFGIDVELPGMKTALIARPPVFGAQVKQIRAYKARAVPGVVDVVQISSGVAVVGEDFWSARRGRDALEIEWEEGALAALDSKEQGEHYGKLAEKPAAVAQRRGYVEGALAKAHKRIEAIYEAPYLAHAPMEPLNCVADVHSDHCEIWTGTQAQTVNRDMAARIAGLDPKQVKLHTMLLGGGFGRRGAADSHFVREAVEISKRIKSPVKVLWTREDDIQGGYYRPRVLSVLRGGLDSNGMPVAWHHRIVSQSIVKGTPYEGMMKGGLDPIQVEGAVDLPYGVPHILVDYQMAPAGIPVLWWRSVGHSFNAFVREGFVDELALAAGKDPCEYRRTLLEKRGAQDHLAVLEYLADRGRWGKPSGTGLSQGIAIHESFGSIVGQIAEVSVSKKGAIRVHRVVCVIDCGKVVNPEIVKTQMESGIVFGLTAALYGAITFKNGRVQQSNFHNYQMVRMKEMPAVEVFVLTNRDSAGGVGETGVPPIAPAVVNAICAATGVRIRRLPIETGELKRK